MTDAGSFLPKQQRSETVERAQLLRQIAEALSLPISAFTRGLPPAASEGPSSAECAAVLAAFSKIRDPHLRARCLEMLEACTTQ